MHTEKERMRKGISHFFKVAESTQMIMPLTHVTKFLLVFFLCLPAIFLLFRSFFPPTHCQNKGFEMIGILIACSTFIFVLLLLLIYVLTNYLISFFFRLKSSYHLAHKIINFTDLFWCIEGAL